MLINKSSEGYGTAAGALAPPRNGTASLLDEQDPAVSDTPQTIERKEARERRREQRQRGADHVESAVDGATGIEPIGSDEATASGVARASREGHGPRRGQPRRPGDRRGSQPGDGAPNAENESLAEQGQESGLLDSAAEPNDEAPPLLTPEGKRGERIAARVQKKQKAAATAVENADDNPALGALNRHLNMMMQQLTAAHRVIGRVAAERDALRQQLADLRGIPVDEIVVSTIGASTETTTRTSETPPAEPATPSRMARLNFFGGDDYAKMRKRRQGLAIGILGLVVILGLASRLGLWAMPSNLSRDSLGQLPYVGDFMTIFLAGWLFFRVIRVSSKGVRWIFPTEDQRRRRR